MTEKSSALFRTAQKYIPGGVNSPVRAFRNVGRDPIFIQKGKGAYLFDVDGRRYIDYVGSWGPLILGHAHPQVLETVRQAASDGFSFGATTEIEVQLAQKICELVPSIELVRCVSSGTEAAMSAIRLARGFTKRDKIIKFAGCYHGHADSLLVAAGSGALTFGVPSSAGVPASIAAHTLVAEFNRLDEVAALFAQYPDEIAAIIVEPVAGNMNLVLPKANFLSGLRELCDQNGSVLIFDEVITGFRVALGGAQAHYQVKPDLTILGKVIGGGFPAAAFGGRADIMRCIAPLGPVYQAGTLSGNPIAMAAGLATLNLLLTENFYPDLAEKTRSLVHGLNQRAQRAGIPFHAVGLGGMFGMFFTDHLTIETEGDVKRCDLALFTKFFHAMLNAGVYFAPSPFEIGFMSAAHTMQDIQQTLNLVETVFAALKNEERKVSCFG